MNETAGRHVAVPGRGQRREPLQDAGHAVIAVLKGHDVLVTAVQPGQLHGQLVGLGTAVDQVHGLERLTVTPQ